MTSPHRVAMLLCAAAFLAACSKHTVTTPGGTVTGKDGTVTVKTKEGTAEVRGDGTGTTGTFEGVDGKTTTVTTGDDTPLPAGWPEGLVPAKGKLSAAIASTDSAMCSWDMDPADVPGELDSLAKRARDAGYTEQGRMNMGDMTTANFVKEGAGELAVIASTADGKGSMMLTWSRK